MKKMKRGYTLFELLVVISIMAVLIALMSISYSAAQKKARDAKRMEDMDMVQKAAEQFYANTENYPNPNLWAKGMSFNYTDGSGNNVLVLAGFPTDPKTGNNYIAKVWGPGGASFTNYCLCALLENGNGNSTAQDCSGMGASGPTALYYCVQNQQ